MVSEKNIIHRVTHWFFYAGMVWVLGMMTLTTIDVTLRHLFSEPISGSIELSEIMLALFGIGGMAYTEHVGANVRVKLLENFLPQRVVILLNILTSLLSLGIILLLVWHSFVVGIEEYHYNTATDTLGIKLYPFYYLLGLGSFFLSLEIFMNILQSIHGFINPTQMKQE